MVPPGCFLPLLGWVPVGIPAIVSSGISQCWAGESGKVALEEDLLGESGVELWVRYEGAKDF